MKPMEYTDSTEAEPDAIISESMLTNSVHSTTIETFLESSF